MQQTVNRKAMPVNALIKMTVTAVFIALIVVMSYTPIGYLRIGTIEISLLAIPVATGGALLGVGSGATLGLAFGITSFLQCFGMSAFGTALMGINPVLTFILCIVPRVLMGAGSAWIFKAVRKKKLQENVSSGLSFLSAAALNTIFFVGFFIVMFGNTPFFAELESGFGTTNIIAFFAAFVGLNGVIESAASCAVGAALGNVIRILQKQLDSRK